MASTRRDYLTGKSEKSARDTFFYYSGTAPVGGALQELEDLLRDGADRRRTGFIAGVATYPLDAGRQHQARSLRDRRSAIRRRRCSAMGGALAAPVTAYIYDWNMLPIGQALWLKELESYKEFPPMQDPASYNLDQVMAAGKKMRRTTP